jgi:uncharacterized membrane protein YccC
MAANKGKIIAFWILTGLIVISQGASGVADLMQAQGLLDGVSALGYPAYILKILGPFKIVGVIALAVPGLLRLKEWAYAGFFFDFTGACLSHVYNGDSIDLILPSLIATLVLLGSYFLRPDSRRLPGPTF